MLFVEYTFLVNLETAYTKSGFGLAKNFVIRSFFAKNQNEKKWIATTYLQRPVFLGPTFNDKSIKIPMNNVKLSTTATWDVFANRFNCRRLFVMICLQIVQSFCENNWNLLLFCGGTIKLSISVMCLHQWFSTMVSRHMCVSWVSSCVSPSKSVFNFELYFELVILHLLRLRTTGLHLLVTK